MNKPFDVLKPLGAMLAVLMVVVLPAVAAEAKNDQQHVLMVYEVGDLVLDVRDYPYPVGDLASEMFGGRMGRFAAGGQAGMLMTLGGGVVPGGSPEASPQQPKTQTPSAGITMDALMEALTSAVEPTSWDEVGGPGSVRPLGTCLMVWQTPAVHRQVTDFLAQLRKSGRRKTVTVDARWLLLNSDELEQLAPANQQGPPQVDREVLAKFTRRPSSIRGLTTCFSGQLVYLVGGTRQTIVSSYIPVVGSTDQPQQRGAQLASFEGGPSYHYTAQGIGGWSGTSGGRAVGYQPVVERPNLGVLLEIRPTLIPGEEAATADLRSTLTVPGTLPPAAVSRRTPEVAPPVDRIAVRRQQLATTLSMPLRQPTIVGGLTYVASSIGPFEGESRPDAEPPQRKAEEEIPQLYLVLELR